jgi:TonB-linked SusC/RagA family outer membrane protein
MKTRFTGILTLLLALVVQVTFAQEKTVSGTVYEASGAPLPGASVVVRGSTVGTQTDFDGNYAIKASVGDVLVFSYVGMEPKNVTVGASNTINVTLEEGLQLEEVIVTAQGIKREKKALGYAVAEVGSDQLEQRAEGDVARVLSGKASGVQITQQSGLSGSGTSIFIRGLSTFSGSNQPLFIVDGVPFNSDTNTTGDIDNDSGNNFVTGNNGSSRFLDLDPNNIENINVLKGLAAATLYGTQGRNGVILITTKNGAAGVSNKKFEVTFSSSFFQTEIASTPDYQNEFGNGFDQAFGWFFSNWGPAFRPDGIDGFLQDGTIRSDGTVRHPYSTASFRRDFPEFAGVRYEYKPYQNVERFFRTGQVAQNNLNLSGTSTDGKMAFNMSLGHLEDKGFTRGNKLTRNNFGLGGRAELSNNFTISGTLNYARTDFVSPPVAAGDGNTVFGGGGSSVFSNVFFTPRSVDLMGLPFENPRDGSSVFYRQNNSIQNPNWTIANAQNRQISNRIFGNGNIQYTINNNLNLNYRVGIDVATEDNTDQQNKGGVNDNAAIRSGFYRTWTNTTTIWDHNVVLNGQYSLSEDIGMTFNTGATTRRELFDRTGVASTGQVVFDVFRHFNFELQDEIQFSQERNIIGVYGQADFDYKRFLYLTVAGRNDWVSNLSVDNRSIFYPSASFSFIPTSAFEGLKNNKVLNYLKIRGGVGTSANFPTGFPVASQLTLDVQRFRDDESGKDVIVNTTSSFKENPDLEPETSTEFEVGIESTWLNSRINLQASYYFRVTEDLIVNRDLDAATGFTSTQTNIGEIETKGVELDLNVDVFKPVNPSGFNWNINANWTINESEVTDLGENSEQVIVFAGFNNLGNAAIEGKPLGVLIGSRVARNDNGDFLVDSQGNYVFEEGQFVIGDPNPDWTLNISNSFSYKGFTLSSLINYTHGGDIYSQTIATLLGRGLIKETANRRETFILPGVQQSNGQPNTVQINNSGFYFDNVLFGPSELQVYDGSVIRLQEVSLSYSVPKSFLDKTPFGSLSLTASGFNLWFDAINTPDGANFDPNVAGLGVGNGRGFDFLNGPSSRRYGLSIKATF